MTATVIPFPVPAAKTPAPRRMTGPTIKTCTRLEQLAIAAGDWEQAEVWRQIALARIRHKMLPNVDNANDNVIPLRRA